MAQSASIQKLGAHHEQLLNYIMVNPCATLRELTSEFGMTAAWISTIIHSQAFQARLAERQDQMFEGAVVTTREKLEGVADAAIEKLGECVAHSADPKYILDVADKALHRLGYAPSTRGNTQAPVQAGMGNTQVNIYGQVDAGTIARARETMQRVRGVAQLPSPSPDLIPEEATPFMTDAEVFAAINSDAVDDAGSA